MFPASGKSSFCKSLDDDKATVSEKHEGLLETRYIQHYEIPMNDHEAKFKLEKRGDSKGSCDVYQLRKIEQD